MAEQGNKLILTITEGEDKGRKIVVERGSCKVLGRAVDQAETVLKEAGQMELGDGDILHIMKYLASSEEETSEKIGEDVNPFGSYSRSDDAILHDNAISRVHAMIFFGQQGAGILDVGSTNGTFVNEERVNVMTLSPGDEIGMGDIQFQVELE